MTQERPSIEEKNLRRCDVKALAAILRRKCWSDWSEAAMKMKPVATGMAKRATRLFVADSQTRQQTLRQKCLVVCHKRNKCGSSVLPTAGKPFLELLSTSSETLTWIELDVLQSKTSSARERPLAEIISYNAPKTNSLQRNKSLSPTGKRTE